jgi:hypothetical protein
MSTRTRDPQAPTCGQANDTPHTPTPGLVRPWSTAPATPTPRRQLKAFFVGLATGALFAGLAVNGVEAGASTTDPPCGFDVYRQTLTVTSLSARGRVRIWLGDQLVRDGAVIRPGETLSFPLRRPHSAARFTVSIVRGGATRDEGQLRNVSRCEPA